LLLFVASSGSFIFVAAVAVAAALVVFVALEEEMYLKYIM
jgi:hypothetical protein